MFGLPPVACGSLHAFLIKMSKCCRVGELHGLPGKSCLRKGFRHLSGLLLPCGDRVFVSNETVRFQSVTNLLSQRMDQNRISQLPTLHGSRATQLPVNEQPSLRYCPAGHVTVPVFCTTNMGIISSQQWIVMDRRTLFIQMPNGQIQARPDDSVESIIVAFLGSETNEN